MASGPKLGILAPPADIVKEAFESLQGVDEPNEAVCLLVELAERALVSLDPVMAQENPDNVKDELEKIDDICLDVRDIVLRLGRKNFLNRLMDREDDEMDVADTHVKIAEILRHFSLGTPEEIEADIRSAEDSRLHDQQELDGKRARLLQNETDLLKALRLFGAEQTQLLNAVRNMQQILSNSPFTQDGRKEFVEHAIRVVQAYASKPVAPLAPRRGPNSLSPPGSPPTAAARPPSTGQDLRHLVLNRPFSHSQPPASNNSVGNPPNSPPLTPGHDPNLPPWVISPSDVVIDKSKPLGKGGFGQVFIGTWHGATVAIKQLSRDASMDALMKEVAAWCNLRHPHVVQFFGASSPALEEPGFVVMQYLQNGDSTGYLQANPKADRVKLLYEVAVGMQYLHRSNIIHGDLKAVNVLITDAGQACLADFGLSEMKMNTTSRVVGAGDNFAGSPRYLAPERWKGVLNRKTDVFAFAMTAVEIFEGQPPFGIVGVDIIYHLVVREDARPDRPEDDKGLDRGLTDGIWDIINKCWLKAPNARPTFTEIVAMWPKTRAIAEGAPAGVTPPAIMQTSPNDQTQRSVWSNDSGSLPSFNFNQTGTVHYHNQLFANPDQSSVLPVMDPTRGGGNLLQQQQSGLYPQYGSGGPTQQFNQSGPIQQFDNRSTTMSPQYGDQSGQFQQYGNQSGQFQQYGNQQGPMYNQTGPIQPYNNQSGQFGNQPPSMQQFNNYSGPAQQYANQQGQFNNNSGPIQQPHDNNPSVMSRGSDQQRPVQPYGQTSPPQTQPGNFGQQNSGPYSNNSGQFSGSSRSRPSTPGSQPAEAQYASFPAQTLPSSMYNSPQSASFQPVGSPNQLYTPSAGNHLFAVQQARAPVPPQQAFRGVPPGPQQQVAPQPAWASEAIQPYGIPGQRNVSGGQPPQVAPAAPVAQAPVQQPFAPQAPPHRRNDSASRIAGGPLNLDDELPPPPAYDDAPVAGPSAGPSAGPFAGPSAGRSAGPSAGPSVGPSRQGTMPANHYYGNEKQRIQQERRAEQEREERAMNETVSSIGSLAVSSTSHGSGGRTTTTRPQSSAQTIVRDLTAEVGSEANDAVKDKMKEIIEVASHSALEAETLVSAGTIPIVIAHLRKRAPAGEGILDTLTALGLLSHDLLAANSVVRVGTTQVLIDICTGSRDEQVIARALWVMGRLCRSDEIAERLVKEGAVAPMLQALRASQLPLLLRASAWALGMLVSSDPLAEKVAQMGAIEAAVKHLGRIPDNAQDPQDMAIAFFCVARLVRTIKLSRACGDAGIVPIVSRVLANSSDPLLLNWASRTVGCLVRPNADKMAYQLLNAGVADGLARVPRSVPADEMFALGSFAFAIQRLSCAEWGGGIRKILVQAGAVDGLLAALRTAGTYVGMVDPSVLIELALAVSFLGDVGGTAIRKEIVDAGGIDILREVARTNRAEVAKTCELAIRSITGNFLSRNTASIKTAMNHDWKGGCPPYPFPPPISS